MKSRSITRAAKSPVAVWKKGLSEILNRLKNTLDPFNALYVGAVLFEHLFQPDIPPLDMPAAERIRKDSWRMRHIVQ